MHVCNASPEQVSGYRDGYMNGDPFSELGEITEEDYEERDAALHFWFRNTGKILKYWIF